MSAAMDRFRALQKKFRAQVPSKKPSAMQRHHILHASSLQQIAEVCIAEMVLGAPHDRTVVDGLQAEVRARLTAAGARNPTPSGVRK